MKIKTVVDPNMKSDEIEIKAKDGLFLKDVSALLSNSFRKIEGKNNLGISFINCYSILYFEVVDNKTFAYTLDAVYEVNLTIAKVATLAPYFIRIAKSACVNMNWVASFTNAPFGCMYALLKNDEKLKASRYYIKDIKNYLLPKGGMQDV